MKTIKNNKGIETLIFAETFENEAFEQVKMLCNFEAYQLAKILIMPDAHIGKGCTVGTTMTISDKITPNLVGGDIVCGMLSVKLNIHKINFEKLDRVINTKVPSGFNVHEKSIKEFDFSFLRCQKYVDLQRAKLSIGTLGGGNHFIELGKSDATGEIYLIIHSGSRKLGGDICKYYQDKAFQNVNEGSKIKNAIIHKLKSEGREKEIDSELNRTVIPVTHKDLAYLTGNDFDDYMNDMAIVQQFASLNRETMAEIILREMGWTPSTQRFFPMYSY